MYVEDRNSPARVSSTQAWYQKNRDKILASARELRAEIIKEYGSKCQCCNEAAPEFLSIDHIGNDGAKHRRAIFGERSGRAGGTPFYRYLKRNGFPKEGLQLLCYNCNFAKGHYGKCPHEKDK